MGTYDQSMPLQLDYRRFEPQRPPSTRQKQRFWDMLALVIWSAVLSISLGALFLAILIH